MQEYLIKRCIHASRQQQYQLVKLIIIIILLTHTLKLILDIICPEMSCHLSHILLHTRTAFITNFNKAG